MGQLHDFARRSLALCHRYDVRGPCIKRRSFLTRPIVALVNRGNASAAPADRVQHASGRLKPLAKALQSGGRRSAQIMRRPRDKRRRVCARVRGGLGTGGVIWKD